MEVVFQKSNNLLKIDSKDNITISLIVFYVDIVSCEQILLLVLCSVASIFDFELVLTSVVIIEITIGM